MREQTTTRLLFRLTVLQTFRNFTRPDLTGPAAGAVVVEEVLVGGTVVCGGLVVVVVVVKGTVVEVVVTGMGAAVVTGVVDGVMIWMYSKTSGKVVVVVGSVVVYVVWGTIVVGGAGRNRPKATKEALEIRASPIRVSVPAK